MQQLKNITMLLSVGVRRDSRSGSKVMDEAVDDMLPVEPLPYAFIERLRLGLCSVLLSMLA